MPTPNHPEKPTPGQELRKQAAAEELVDPNPLSMELRKRVQPHDFLFWKEPGVQEGVWKKLRLGKYTMEARLDLHLMTVKEARQALHEFLNDCRENDIRTILICHGRGEQSQQKATMKSYTRQWLERTRHRSSIPYSPAPAWRNQCRLHHAEKK